MTKRETGLSDAEVLASREKNGTNELTEKKRKSLIARYFSNFNDPIIRVLIGALILNILFMFPDINIFETGGIALAIFTSTLVSTISEYGSERAFLRLRSEGINRLCRVRRNGNITEIPISNIVCGDVVILEAGSTVPADGRIIHGAVKVDQSALTGESAEIEKMPSPAAGMPSPADPGFLLRGSLLSSGYGEMEVTCVGDATFYGRIASDVQEEKRPSPLKRRLTELASNVSFVGYVAAAMIAFAYLFNVFVIDNAFDSARILSALGNGKFVLSEILNALTLAVSVIVMAVPEGLPMMITVVLSSNMKRMMRDHVLVRKLVGIETAGSLNILFTDKTGTLTQGKLKVEEAFLADGTVFRSFKALSENEIYRKRIAECAICNNAAVLSDGKAAGSDATDRSILAYAADYREPLPKVLDRLPFDSQRKYSATVVGDRDTVRTYVKGAPEKILSQAKYLPDKNGNLRQMTERERETVSAKITAYGKRAYRVVALAYREGLDTSADSPLVFLCLLAIRDKVRKEVPNAIRDVENAGVDVIMITGDNPTTAEAIAKECGLIHGEKNLVLTGTELSTCSDERIRNILPRIAVIARALPNDKARLVRISQECGLVVGMTGDGINDASALKRADVGFAMGSGTDVAKDAGDIIITDDNFLSISKAILYGRTIFESIRKFILFQLTMNVGAVGISMIGPFIGIDNPITVTQMLWVNMIMDTLGGLAFSGEPAERKTMEKPPKPKDEKIISPAMVRRIFTMGTYLLFLCVFFLKSSVIPELLQKQGYAYRLSAFFALFIFTGVCVCFTSRTERIDLSANLSRNKPFMFIMGMISVLQLTFIYFGGSAFRAVPLTFRDLCAVLLFSASVVPFDALIKFLLHRAEKRKKSKNISEIACNPRKSVIQ